MLKFVLTSNTVKNAQTNLNSGINICFYYCTFHNLSVFQSNRTYLIMCEIIVIIFRTVNEPIKRSLVAVDITLFALYNYHNV